MKSSNPIRPALLSAIGDVVATVSVGEALGAGLMDGSCDSLGCALGLGLALGPIDMVGVEVGSAVAIVGATVGVTVARAVRTSMPPTLLAT